MFTKNIIKDTIFENTAIANDGSKKEHVIKINHIHFPATNVYKTLKIDFPEMTDLEFWTFMCIVSVFLSLLSYGVILIKDQMIIQVVIILITRIN